MPDELESARSQSASVRCRTMSRPMRSSCHAMVAASSPIAPIAAPTTSLLSSRTEPTILLIEATLPRPERTGERRSSDPARGGRAWSPGRCPTTRTDATSQTSSTPNGRAPKHATPSAVRSSLRTRALSTRSDPGDARLVAGLHHERRPVARANLGGRCPNVTCSRISSACDARWTSCSGCLRTHRSSA